MLRLSVPFCVQDCGFCSRNVIPGWDSARLRRFMEALRVELEANAAIYGDCLINAVHFGGGIASNAGGPDIADTMRLIRRLYRVTDDVSVTMRSSIANISGASMPLFRRAGITRFDFEVLSLDPLDAGKVNKVDALGDVPVICDHFLHAAANDLLGLVFLVGHRALAEAGLRRSLIAADAHHAAHMTLQACEGEAAVGAKTLTQQLRHARELLGQRGYREYLPLVFARAGCEDRFLLARAANRPLIGFGLGARTIIDGVVSTNTEDLTTYLAYSADFRRITAAIEPLAPT